jgi:hypothetical protein
MSPGHPFSLFDTRPRAADCRYSFDSASALEATELLAGPVETLHRRLLNDQESQAVQLAALRILDAAPLDLDEPAPGAHDVAALLARIDAVRSELSPVVADLLGRPTETRRAVLLQRAPVALLAGCWLDLVSQPATQPDPLVNLLFEHHLRLKGANRPEPGQERLRRRVLADLGVSLPPLDSEAFLARAAARPLTVWHCAYLLALGRLPSSHLPEVLGVHVAYHLLGVDDQLLGEAAAPALQREQLVALLDAFQDATRTAPHGAELRGRLHRAVEGLLRMERDHLGLLTEHAAWHQELTLADQAGRILLRHARYAGAQHRSVRLAGRPLPELLTECQDDPAALVSRLSASPYLRRRPDGSCRFIDALRFGGPMFGIFDEPEAATLRAWARTVANSPATAGPEADRSGAAGAERWSTAVAHSRSAREVVAEPGTPPDRVLFQRLVAVEQHTNLLPQARSRALATLAAAEVLFEHGSRGHHTDASYFDYTAQALLDRVEAVYWERLVRHCAPVAQLPTRDEVVTARKRSALSHLVDGAWAHRTGGTGRSRRRSDTMLFAIYADEMGRGDLRLNHLTLIRDALHDMAVEVPHISDPAFAEQDQLPDDRYPFAIHQLCLSLFPDSLHNEILGFNLGIEMFGLGELGLQVIEGLTEHGFDASYERTHLTIDNMSAGHARQAADLIVAFLEDVRRTVGPEGVQREWRRVWRGYASFAWFVERPLVQALENLARRRAVVAAGSNGGAA